MALAIIEGVEFTDKTLFVQGNIGVNRFYALAFGFEVNSLNGIAVLENPFYKSPIHGAISREHNGRIEIRLPFETVMNSMSGTHAKLAQELRIQLASFADEYGRGFSLSDPMIFPIGSLRMTGAQMTPSSLRPNQTEFVPGYFQSQALSRSVSFNQLNPVKAFHYRSNHPARSKTMFLEQLMPLIPQVLPLIGQLVSAGNQSAAPQQNRSTQLVIPPEITQLLQTLIGTLQPLTTQNTTTQNSSAQSFSINKSFSTKSQLSQSFVAPALLAALPALMPLLQQVLNPENIKNVLEAPTKHMETVFNGLKEFAKLGLESHEQDLAHLRALNPGVDDPALDQLLASMSLSQARASALEPTGFKWVPSVKLKIINLQSHMINGQNKWLYSLAGPIGFQCQINSPQTIAKAYAELEISTLATGEVQALHRQSIGSIATPQQIVNVFIPQEKLQQLQAGEDAICTLRVMWKNSKNQWRGTSIQQTFTPVRQYIYDHVEQGQQQLVLDDPQQYQGYWHQFWSKLIDEPLKRTDLTIRYFLALKFENQKNTPLQTEFKIIEHDQFKVKAKARSGMDFSLSQLVQLTQHFAPHLQVDSEMVSALKTQSFVRRFTQAGEYTAKVRAAEGDQVKIWVYPEMQMTDIVLQKAQQTNNFGQILELISQHCSLLMPVALHFKGIKSTDDERQMFLDKVNLYPVQLVDTDHVMAKSVIHVQAQAAINKPANALKALRLKKQRGARSDELQQDRRLGKGYTGGLSQRLKIQ